MRLMLSDNFSQSSLQVTLTPVPAHKSQLGSRASQLGHSVIDGTPCSRYTLKPLRKSPGPRISGLLAGVAPQINQPLLLLSGFAVNVMPLG